MSELGSPFVLKHTIGGRPSQIHLRLLPISDVPCRAPGSGKHADQHFSQEDVENVEVELLLKSALLLPRLGRVLHDLCLVACVHYHSNNPVSVLETRSPEQQLVVAKTDGIRQKVTADSAFKLVQELVRTLAVDLPYEPYCSCLIVDKL